MELQKQISQAKVALFEPNHNKSKNYNMDKIEYINIEGTIKANDFNTLIVPTEED